MLSDLEETVILFRPVGQLELDLIRESGCERFPQRLSHQPIFYPVLTQEYAAKIARDWNTKDAASQFSGYVTKFCVKKEFLKKYPVQIVGSRDVHQELWIPAEDLDEFNNNLVGQIEVIESFFPSTD